MKLRKSLFASTFPDHTAGTRYYDLPDGSRVKGVARMTYNIDEASLGTALQALRDKGLTTADSLVRYKPSLEKKAYDRLTQEEKKLFNVAVITKPGSPALEYIPPKEKV
jgi:hypothetical protein